MKNFISKSEKDTLKYCKDITKLISIPCVIKINGDVGTGKTFISRNIAEEFDHVNIASSSFQKVTYYPGNVSLIHCDFYKSVITNEFFYSEIEPLLEGKWILILEWCHDFPFELKAQRTSISINHIHRKHAREISTLIEN